MDKLLEQRAEDRAQRLQRAEQLLREWEVNATEEFRKQVKHSGVMFTPTPTSLLGKTRAFLNIPIDPRVLGEGNDKEKVYTKDKPKRTHPWRIWREGGFSSDKHVKDKIIPLNARMGVGT